METLDHSDDGSGCRAGAWIFRPVQVAILFFVLCSLSMAQSDAGGAVVLQTIRERAVDNLRALPNYTCTATIERSGRQSASRRYENIDRIRLEIGYVGGRELYGWPGGEKIAEDDLRQLVGGTITNGDFALLTRVVFAGPGVVFRNIRREDVGGRAVVSGEFTASREGSQWIVGLGPRTEPVGYSGSFQVDAELLQLIDLRMTAERIPREFGYRGITRNLEFQPVQIGSREFLLPSRAELSTVARDGPEVKNETRFTNCHEFTAQSVVSFGEPNQEANVETVHRTQVSAADLPDEFEARLELESPIDSDTSAVGDPITARLVKKITGRGGMEIPKGATLHGRIRVLDVTEGHRYANFAFLSFEWAGSRVNIAGRVNQLVTASSRTARIGRQPGTWTPQTPLPVPHQVTSLQAGPIRAYGRHLVLRRGFQFRLKSRAGAR